MKSEKLREYIRNIVKEILEEVNLDEISTSSATPGYLTPGAFVGDKNSERKRKEIDKVNKTIGYTLTDRGRKEITSGDKLEENYYDYRNDTSKQPHQKIGSAISEVNRQLKLIERAIRMNRRLQKECGVTNDQLWGRTKKQIVKLEAKLMHIASRLREMRG